MQSLLFSMVQPIAAASGGDVPEFIHLVPAGTFTTQDGRGPFTVVDAAALIAASMPGGRKLAIDVNHAIDKLTERGEEAPAVGWIVAMEARADGIWGKVEWNEAGRKKVGGKEYGFISPVILLTKTKPHRVTQILRASLTNAPALTTLASLNSRQTGDPEMENELRTALGLPETADQAAILVAVNAALGSSSAMTRIAEAAGLQKTATADDIVAAFTARGGSGELTELRDQVKSLNTQLTSVNAQLATVLNDGAKERATAFVEKAIEEGKIVPVLRDHFVARHVKNPKEVEDEIKLMPSINAGGLGNRRVVESDGKVTLSEEDKRYCARFGVDPEAYRKTLEDEQKAAL